MLRTDTNGASIELEGLAGVEREELLALSQNGRLVDTLRGCNEQGNLPGLQEKKLAASDRKGEPFAYQMVSLSLGSGAPPSKNLSWRTRIPPSSSVTVRTGNPICKNTISETLQPSCSNACLGNPVVHHGRDIETGRGPYALPEIESLAVREQFLLEVQRNTVQELLFADIVGKHAKN